MDWILHVPVTGMYWVVFGLPQQFPKDRIPNTVVEDTKAFKCWFNDMSPYPHVKRRIQSTMLQKYYPHPTAELAAVKCEPGVLFMFPAMAWEHSSSRAVKKVECPLFLSIKCPKTKHNY